MSRTTDAYAAGLIDGEGCILIQKSKGPTYHHLVTIGMTQKALETLRRMQRAYGGNIKMMRPSTEKWDAAYGWTVAGQEAKALLEAVLPFLVLKEEQARLALKLVDLHASLPRRFPNSPARAWTPEARERGELIKQRMHELNAKGPSSPPMPKPIPGAKPFAQVVAGQVVELQADLFSDLGWAPYVETFPESGMTRNGVLYERRTSAHHTNAPECLSLPTPRASEGEKGGPNQKGSSGDLTLSSAIVRMLPTPTTNLGENGGSQDPTKRRAGGHSVSLQDVAEHLLLPTPRTTRGGSATETMELLPTPAAGNFNDGEDVAAWDARRIRVKEATGNGNGMGEPLSVAAKRLASTTASTFGEYTPAIRRWERITGHPAPAPTEPTGRGGAHRLSAKFAEWMMGLDPGWVTDVPISRTAQLRAIGNGVVPQQAIAALADMKQHFEPRLVRGSFTSEGDE
nr:hypothetical protein [Kocuria indica]